MVPVKLVRTIESYIEEGVPINGCLYVATDTGKVYLGLDNNELLELMSIKAGPGLQKHGDILQTDVTDVVNASGSSLVDPYGVAHIPVLDHTVEHDDKIYYTNANILSGNRSVSLTLPSPYASGIAWTYDVSNIISISAFVLQDDAQTNTSQYVPVNCDWSIDASSVSSETNPSVHIKLSRTYDHEVYVSIKYANVTSVPHPEIDVSEDNQNPINI